MLEPQNIFKLLGLDLVVKDSLTISIVPRLLFDLPELTRFRPDSLRTLMDNFFRRSARLFHLFDRFFLLVYLYVLLLDVFWLFIFDTL